MARRMFALTMNGLEKVGAGTRQIGRTADLDARSAPGGRAPGMARVNALVNDNRTQQFGEVAERLNALVLKTSKGL